MLQEALISSLHSLTLRKTSLVNRSKRRVAWEHRDIFLAYYLLQGGKADHNVVGFLSKDGELGLSQVIAVID